MAISNTTFAQRMDKINAGKTTAWTVPGEGLASVRDERSFLSKAGIKQRVRSTHARRNPLVYLMAMLAGAVSVIAARWIDFTYLDTALGFASEKGLDVYAYVADVPTSMVIAAVLSTILLMVLGIRNKAGMGLMGTGFVGAMVFEADLVRLAPDFYARFYPQSWIADMMAQATLLT